MKWLCGFALFIFTWWSSHTVFVSSQDNGSDVNFDSFSRWRRSAMDWNVVRRLWEKWASNNVGSSGGPAFSLGFLFGSIWIFDRVSLKPITRGCTKFQVSLWRQLYWLTMIRLDRLAWYQPCKQAYNYVPAMVLDFNFHVYMIQFNISVLMSMLVCVHSWRDRWLKSELIIFKDHIWIVNLWWEWG